MQQDLVSVIMPTYNAGKFLSGSIDSILNQTYQHLELLITDDHSTDPDTLNVLKEYSSKDKRVKVEYLNDNHGPGYARDRSIDRAQGRYIAFCDSDDRWFPEKLEQQIRFMAQKDCALSYTSYITCDDNNHETGIVIAPPRVSFNMMKRDNKIGCLTAVYDVAKLGKKYFMPTLRKRQDWALFLTIIRKCRMAYGITEPLAYYRQRPHSISSNKLSLIKYNVKVYQTILGYSKAKAYLYFFCLFLPTYQAKVIKRRHDSKLYLQGKGRKKL
jgi:glycosyltransferase involved in cell wall biosynthesis